MVSGGLYSLFSPNDKPSQNPIVDGAAAWQCVGSVIGTIWNDNGVEWICRGQNIPTADGDQCVDNTVVWAARQASGIQLNTQAVLDNLLIEFFTGHGIHVRGIDPSGTDFNNADGWRGGALFLNVNEGSGIFIDVGNSSSGHVTSANLAGNQLWGVDDHSEYGNVYLACNSEGNGSDAEPVGGSYQITAPFAGGMFLSCFFEGSYTQPNIQYPSNWIAGAGSSVLPGFSDASAQGLRLLHSGKSSPITFVNEKGSSTIETSMGFEDTSLSALRWTSDDVPLDMRLSYNSIRNGRWGVRWGNADSYGGMTILGGNALPKPGLVGFTYGVLMGNPVPGYERRVVVSNQVPVRSDAGTGLWTKGDVILNANAADGGPIGWVCIQTGGWGYYNGAALQTWQQSPDMAHLKVVSLGDSVEPTVANTFVYQCTDRGQTGATGTVEPTWPLVIGNSTMPEDNGPFPMGTPGPTWKCIGYTPALFRSLGPLYPPDYIRPDVGNSAIKIGMPLLGDDGAATPDPGRRGLAGPMMGDANYGLVATEFINEMIIIKSSVALTAVRTVTLPNLAGYKRWIFNKTTGGFSLTITTGVGGGALNVTLGNNMAAWVMCDAAGSILRMSADTATNP